ncbi:MAG: hypothetical protein FWC43_07220 [Planctomycetaceae bacterium]|nr:hypothetical protein [Planctomycetaceae bacterium]
MSKFFRGVSFFVVITIAIPAAYSQQERRSSSDPSRGSRYQQAVPQQGNDPSRSGSFGSGRTAPAGTPADAESTANRRLFALNALKSMDTNNDGRLAPSEVPESRRMFVQMVAQRVGVDPNGPIDLRALERIMMASSPISSSPSSSAAKSTITLPANPLVPYFGEVSMAVSTATSVLAFGQRENRVVVPIQSPQNLRGSRGQQTQNADLQLQQTMKAARDLLARNDKNRNGTLDKLNDEWNGLPFDANTADKNKDGRLTLSEIVAALGGKLGANLGAARATAVNGSVQDRMPEGVPDWFTQRDANKDGQLSMLEFANGQPFTDEMINEFKANDINGDGIITIEEAYAFMKKMDDEKRQKETEAAQQAAGQTTGQTTGRTETASAPESSQQYERQRSSQSVSSSSGQNSDRSGRSGRYSSGRQRGGSQQRD